MANSSELRFEYVPEIQHVATGQPAQEKASLFWQVVRFAVVGISNTGVDILFLNCLLFLYPTNKVGLLIGFNSLAYLVGAVNSFVLNKYWTFGYNKGTTRQELLSFAIVSFLGICCNNLLLALFASAVHPPFLRQVVWTNAAKIFAITGTAIISFFGMRLWVFTGRPSKRKERGRLVPMKLADEEERELPGVIELPSKIDESVE